EAHGMDFELLDGYLLDGRPAKAAVIERLSKMPPGGKAAPFLEGIRLLGERTPDLALIALRLVLGGGTADDASVSAVRDAVQRARAGDESARADYAAAVGNFPKS
ncbi:MAG TPA: hypothetical protein VN936_05190, partial [Candidatus Acidoferrum sp.]|nr:hypothetical protein [Candidatus Acidoferrum sp.]